MIASYKDTREVNIFMVQQAPRKTWFYGCRGPPNVSEGVRQPSGPIYAERPITQAMHFKAPEAQTKVSIMSISGTRTWPRSGQKRWNHRKSHGFLRFSTRAFQPLPLFPLPRPKVSSIDRHGFGRGLRTLLLRSPGCIAHRRLRTHEVHLDLSKPGSFVERFTLTLAQPKLFDSLELSPPMAPGVDEAIERRRVWPQG